MDKINSMSNLLDLEVSLISQIHNLVNENEREGEAPYDYLDQVKRMMIRKIDNTFDFVKRQYFLNRCGATIFYRMKI